MITCRRARPEERAVIVGFQRAMARETEDLELEPEVIERGVRAVFERDGVEHYRVAEEDGQVLGSLMITPEWSDWRDGWVWWIQSVYVIPAARRRGVYRQLYAHLQEEVRQLPEVRGIRLYVEKSNRVAQQVYRSLGMNDQHYDLFEWFPG